MNPHAPTDGRPLGRHHQHHHHPNQQQSRFAHVSSPWPPNRPNVSDNPNVYAPQNLQHYQHQHQPQQRRLLPSPTMPPAYHPSPTPPQPLTSPRLQYEFAARGLKPVYDDRDRRSTYHHHHHHHHALVDSNRRVLGGDESPIVENRAGLQFRHQTTGNNFVCRQYYNADVNPGVQRHAVEHRAASPYGLVDGYRGDPEPTSRVRVRGNYSEEFGSSRRFASVAGCYADEPHTHERDKTGVWVHGRESSRDLGDSSANTTNYGVNDSGNPGYRGSEFGRYSGVNRGSREVVREYSLAPKKQLQKKSAFTRLQTPGFNHRNRENKRQYSSNCDDDSAYNSASFRGKGQGQFSYSDYGPKDRREDGSVDLDVSFKSNTLIAKPVVPLPPTSSVVVPEKNPVLLTKKLKSAIVSVTASTSSPHDKLNQNDDRLNSSPSAIGATMSTSKKPEQLQERVGASDAQAGGSLGHVEGIVSKYDTLVKSDSSLLPVSEVPNVLSATSGSGRSTLSLVVDKAGFDFKAPNEAAPDGQNLNGGSKNGMVTEKFGRSVCSAQGETVDTELTLQASTVKDAVPEGQVSNIGSQRDAVLNIFSESFCSAQDKTSDKELPYKSPSTEDVVPEGQDSNAGPKRDVASGKDGKSVDLSQDIKGLPCKTNSVNSTSHRSVYSTQDNNTVKGLPSKAPSANDAVPQGQDYNAGPIRYVVSGEDGKSVDLGQDNKGLSGKVHSVKDAVIEGQDSASGKSASPTHGKTAVKQLPRRASFAKDAVSHGQYSNVGPKKEVVSDKDGNSIEVGQHNRGLPGKMHSLKDAVPEEQDSVKRVCSTEGKTAVKGLPLKAPSATVAVPAGQDSNAGTKTDVLSDKVEITVGSGHDKTADKCLPGNAHMVMEAVPEGQVSTAGPKRNVISVKDEKNVGKCKDIIAFREGRDSSAGANRGLISDKDAKNGVSSQSKTTENATPNKGPAVKIARKKKIVKKVVRKVVTRHGDPLNRQNSRKHDEPVKAGSLTASASCKGLGSLKEKIESCSVVLSQNYGLTLDSSEAGVFLQTNQETGASQAYGNDTDTGTYVLCDKKDKDCCSSLCPETCEETEADAPCANNSVNDLLFVSSMDDLTVPLASADANISMDKFNGQLLQDAKCLPLENLAGKDCPVGDSSTMCPLNSGGSTIHDGCKAVDESSWGSNAVCALEEDLSGSLDLPIVSAKKSTDAVECSNPHADHVTTVFREDSRSIIKTYVSSGSTNSEDSIMGLSTVLSHDAWRQLSLAGDPKKLDNGSGVNPQKIVSIAEDSKEYAPSHEEISQVDAVCSREVDICMNSMDITCSCPSHVEDMTLDLSIKDPNSAAVSILGGLTVGLEATANVHDASQRRDSIDAYEPPRRDGSADSGSDLGDGIKTPPPRKRRKVCSPYQGYSDAGKPQDNDLALSSDRSTSVVRVQSTSLDSCVQPEAGIPGPNVYTLQEAASVSTPQKIGVLLEDTSQVGYSNSRSSVRDNQLLGVHASSYLGHSVTANGESLSWPSIEGRLEEDFPAVSLAHDHRNLDIGQARSGDKRLDLDPVEELVMSESERLKFSNPEINLQISDGKFLPSNTEIDASRSLKDESPYFSLSVDVDSVYASNSKDAVTESVSDVPDKSFSERFHDVFAARTSAGIASLSPSADEGVVKNNDTDHEEDFTARGLSLSADTGLTSGSRDNVVDYSSDHAAETSCALTNKTVIFPSNGSRSMNCSPNPSSADLYGRMNRQTRVIRRGIPGHSSFNATNSKIPASSTSKPNTWRRTSNASVAAPGNKPSVGTIPTKGSLPGKSEKLQNASYVRKGNSLVRKPGVALPPTGTVPIYRLSSSDVQDLKKSIVYGNAEDVKRNVQVANQKIPPQSCTHELPAITTVPSASLASFQAASPSAAVPGVAVSNSKVSSENDALKTCTDVRVSPEIQQEQTVSVSNSGMQNGMDDESLITCNNKRITYVKRKSNQLVATSSDSDVPIPVVDKMQSFPPEGYYKRKRNQLIRTSLDSSENDNANMVAGQDAKVISSKGRRQSLKAKLRTSFKRASVWTLRGSSGNFSTSKYEKVIPHFVPWKRTTYWRNFARNSAAIGDNRSLCAISRRLMLLRKRDTVYVRSSHGLSLRKAKVVSVGGRSLKWSKSIERQSKKASEEATRAVAAVAKERRHNDSPPIGSISKNKNRSSRERIFRIGNVRYKMDASRRTLIRISDDEPSLPAASQLGSDAKKSYVPRRLVIGNDEYVRIGNGNQLVRNPKKRTRILANEKVKWSLHTARLKLAKKRKYCQFFTRFGKCNKGDGKCPYIHDPSKIAVCTKFLSGSCSNKDCKLTHEVIPERMPDCSYFLQGLCTNRNCPYRHVNVNPSASTCEGFLRGYCADGNECRKKHSYVCQVFESTGNCPLGSKCKLHHPKSRSKGKKRKRSTKEKNNAMGRYFGSSTCVRASDSVASVREKLSSDENYMKNGKENPLEEKFADFISLDFADYEEEEEEGGEDMVHAVGDEAGDDLDMELDYVNELMIKPIGLMNVMA